MAGAAAHGAGSAALNNGRYGAPSLPPGGQPLKLVTRGDECPAHPSVVFALSAQRTIALSTLGILAKNVLARTPPVQLQQE